VKIEIEKVGDNFIVRVKGDTEHYTLAKDLDEAVKLIREYFEDKQANTLTEKIEKINRRVRLIERFLRYIHTRNWKFFLRVMARRRKKDDKYNQIVLKFIKKRGKRRLR